MTSPTDPIAALETAHQARLDAERAAELAELEAVAAARTAGATWQQVADATGKQSRQVAERVFARRLVKTPGTAATYAVKPDTTDR